MSLPPLRAGVRPFDQPLRARSIAQPYYNSLANVLFEQNRIQNAEIGAKQAVWRVSSSRRPCKFSGRRSVADDYVFRGWSEGRV